MRLLIDHRWDADTGIGKLYREVMARIPAHISPAFVESSMRLGNLLTPLMLARQIRQHDADVFYSPSFMPPLYSHIPVVFTIHDLMHLFYYTKWHRLYYQQVIARLAAKADQVITVSHFSKGQLVDLLGIDEGLITVVYNGVDDRYRTNKEAYESDVPYFLYVGNRRANKNIRAMLEAFAHAAIPQDFQFFLTGARDRETLAIIERLGIGKRVRFLGHVSEERLPALYRGAQATLFVSLMEGFGLPVIESMAAGTPVLTSTAGPLPEVAGDAALCVDPGDVAAITGGIEVLANDSSRHRLLTEAGLSRAAQFTWDNTATRTWEAITNTKRR
ncbi:glycosyltransferase family 4 protein [Parapedobacter sp. 10938]|uniref:glycosyltransferase family 4 protein n=1 Tax=Parapedobacter flavus TaxID=3110225 RepID=UPI002DB6451F|nr:glycosyltransferase family 1 protein [Parapedobacter sp. 10938]MEC3881232.1 glycosyltransferase family 1 protein [Parapedobacter sp. 10938]